MSSVRIAPPSPLVINLSIEKLKVDCVYYTNKSKKLSEVIIFALYNIDTMSSSLSQFNTAIYDFVRFIRETGHMSDEVNKLETYIEVTRVNARILISNFQKYVLRDVFVSNILKNNVNYFLNIDIVKEYEIIIIDGIT